MEPSEPNIAAIYKQQTLDKWMHMGIDDPGVSMYLIEDEQESSLETASEKWTRVFTRDNQLPGLSPSYPIGDDLLYDQAMRAALYQMDQGSGEALFSPL